MRVPLDERSGLQEGLGDVNRVTLDHDEGGPGQRRDSASIASALRLFLLSRGRPKAAFQAETKARTSAADSGGSGPGFPRTPPNQRSHTAKASLGPPGPATLPKKLRVESFGSRTHRGWSRPAVIGERGKAPVQLLV